MSSAANRTALPGLSAPFTSNTWDVLDSIRNGCSTKLDMRADTGRSENGLDPHLVHLVRLGYATRKVVPVPGARWRVTRYAVTPAGLAALAVPPPTPVRGRRTLASLCLAVKECLRPGPATVDEIEADLRLSHHLALRVLGILRKDGLVALVNGVWSLT